MAAIGINRGTGRMEAVPTEAGEAAEGSMELLEERKDTVEKEEPVARASSYKEIYAHLEETDRYIIKEYAADDVSSGEKEQAVTEAAAKDYSATNVREAGVDEADIVKTDGEYIYTAADSSNKVQIIKAGDLRVCAEVKAEGIGSVREIYVENGRLVILSGGGDTALAKDNEGIFYSEYRTKTAVTVYDISSPEKPKRTGSVSQEGEYRTSRKVGEYLYLFTDCWKQKGDEADVKSYIPEAGGKLLSEDCIYLPGNGHRDIIYL